MGIVYEAFDTERNMSVAVKTLIHMDMESLYYFKKEFRSLHDLVHPNLCSFIDLIEDDGCWLLTMELLHGTDLLTYVCPPTNGPRSMASAEIKNSQNASGSTGFIGPETDWPSPMTEQYFNEKRLRSSIAGLCEGLNALHSVGKVHRDIKPSNVMVTDDDRVVLLDFGLIADAEHQRQTELGAIVGTAAYMAPEQSLDETIGPAADWYAVGVILYEALTKTLPFDGPPLRILLDKQNTDPVPPSKKRQGLPQDLELLCLDLLRRDPKARPERKRILEVVKARKTESVVFATTNLSVHTQSPVFVGRQTELSVLNGAYERVVKKGNFESVIVEGVSGVGKSTLVRNFVQEFIPLKHNAIILQGRCYERESAPYKAFDGIIESLASHIRHISEDEARAYLPTNPQNLVRLFPGLLRSAIFSEIAMEAVNITDPKALLMSAFEACRELIANISSQHPLVIILDDMQWADNDSLSLLEYLVKGSDSIPALLILLSRFGTGIEESALDWQSVTAKSHARIRLSTLDEKSSLELARAFVNQERLLFHLDPGLIVSEAKGHPLYIAELVRHAALDAGEWRNLRLDDVIWSRVKMLPPQARTVLELICVTGTPIARRHLQSLTFLKAEDFAKSILLLRASNLIRSRGPSKDHFVEPYHDRVREAVVAHLSGVGQVKRIHLDIARFLTNVYTEDELEENIFEVVRHLEAAKDLITEEEEILHLADLYFRAGQKAQKSAAYSSALAFFKESINIYPRANWKNQYERMFQLYSAAAECAYVEGKYSQAKAFVNAVNIHASSDIDRATVCETYYKTLAESGKPEEALEVAVSMIRRLGVKLPARPSKSYVLLRLLRSKMMLDGKSEEELLGLPSMTNPKIVVACRLLIAAANTAFLYRPNLWVGINLKSIALSFEHGIDHNSTSAFLGWATINCGVLGKFQEGYKWGKAVLKIRERFKEDSRTALQLFVWATFVQHWKEPLRNTLPYMLESHKIAHKTGAVFFWVYSIANYCYHSFFSGENLQRLVSEFEKYRNNLVNRGHVTADRTVGIYHQTVLNFLGESEDPTQVVGTAYDETVMLALQVEQNQTAPLYDLFQCKMILCLLFGCYEDAYIAALETEKYSSAVIGTYSFGVRSFYDSITCLKFCEETARKKKAQLLKRVTANQKKLQKYAIESPANYLHKYHLVKAEQAGILQKTDRAQALYDEAIRGAIENGFVNDAAFACELAALRFAQIGRPKLCRSYALDACSHYREWGALAKVRHVKKVFELSGSL